ncbi:MAG: M23 family metallopeptidase [Blastocatellia bacterium]|nr:M23 family metallopeptidase [Blastocatellia bacterium]
MTPRPTQKASRTPRDQRFYTLFLAPGATSKIRQVHIPFSVIYTVCSFAVIGVLTTAIGIGWLVQKAMALSEMSFVRTQNRELKHENHELKLRYDDLNQRVTAIQDISKELAAQAKLPQAAEPPIARNAAGGPEIANQIENNAQALERELRQLRDIYNGDALKLANTPNGLPVRGYLTDGFGSRNNPFSGEGSEFHSGQDISVPHGTPVAATANGLVLYAAPRAGYGNVVVIDHGNGVTTRYGHLSAFDVEAGQRIRRGDIIGRAGNTGRSTGTHVHYEVREYDVPTDPLRFVPGMVARNR